MRRDVIEITADGLLDLITKVWNAKEGASKEAVAEAVAEKVIEELRAGGQADARADSNRDRRVAVTFDDIVELPPEVLEKYKGVLS